MKDSCSHIEKNMTKEMLDDSDANHSRPIVNYFGNLDREIRICGQLTAIESLHNLVRERSCGDEIDKKIYLSLIHI